MFITDNNNDFYEPAAAVFVNLKGVNCHSMNYRCHDCFKS